MFIMHQQRVAGWVLPPSTCWSLLSLTCCPWLQNFNCNSVENWRNFAGNLKKKIWALRPFWSPLLPVYCIKFTHYFYHLQNFSWSIVYGGLASAVCNMQCTVYTVQYVLSKTLCAVCTVHCTLCSWRCAICVVLSAVCTVQSERLV